ncbi:MAG: diguanylate cyclase [Candidatus Aminicenantes bacterium]|nr:diguanylate cyclase [Candidatus Aminicenantes bacterium]
MERSLRILRFFLVTALFPAVASFGQVLPFEVLGLREGLPQSQVTCFAQDETGFLWIGTLGGLARYNGFGFSSFVQQGDLPSERIHELLIGPDGKIWIATAGGLSVYENDSFRDIKDPLVADVRCRALAFDGEGRLCVGTDEGLVVGREGAFSRIGLGENSEQKVVYDVLAAEDGLAVCGEAGLWIFLPGAEPRPLPAPPGLDKQDFRVLADTAEGLWLGTFSEGLWLFQENRWRLREDVSAQSVYRLTVGRSGTLYVATNGNGLYLKRPERSDFLKWDASNGLPSNIVNFAEEDREGNLWIGTDIGGLARLLGRASVYNHTADQGLPDSCVFGIAPGDTLDSLWLGTLRGAVHYRVRPEPKVLETLSSADGLVNELVWKAFRAPDGTLWILTDTAVLRRRPGEKRSRAPGADAPIPSSIPWDMVMDLEGRIWFCGEGPRGGLAALDRRGRWRAWSRTEEGEDFLRCQHVTVRRRGGVWAVMDNRIFFCDGDSLAALRDQPPLRKGPITNAVFEDSQGRLWLGTDSSLVRLERDRRWTILDQKPGLESRHIFAVGEDDQGIVWVATARGAFLFKPNDEVECFSPGDGLANWEMNQYGFYSDGRNGVYLGTISGLTQYAPGRARENLVPPGICLEAVDLAGGTIPFPRSLDLGWDQRTLNFHIALLSFRDRSKVFYRARMENLEDEWTPPLRLSELRYTNMPPGRFHLALQAVNESGVAGPVVRIPIRVRPPFWRTPLFNAAAVVLLLAGAVGTYFWRTAIIRRRNRELEAVVVRRTEDLRQANSRLNFLATFDPLTGLLNRRAVMEKAEAEVSPPKGENRQIGCLLIDLDRFKSVNDTFGHAAGDEALREAARHIQSCLRDTDFLGRIGGDEFLAVLPGADPAAVRTVCERIASRRGSEDAGRTPIRVGTSCGGVAVPGRSGASLASVLAQADALLYRAKNKESGFEADVYRAQP